MTTDVLVIGSLNFDILIQQDRLPHLGETFTGDGMMMMPGGKGANQAVQCAKLGLAVNMVGCVGQDMYGQELLQSLEKYQVATQNIKRCGTSGVGIVQIMKEGDYCSTIIKGANYHITAPDLKDVFFSDRPLVILQSEIPPSVVDEAVKKAVRFGCPILLNNAPAREIAAETLRQVNYLVVNETEAAFMLGTPVNDVTQANDAALQLSQRINGTVIVTLGEKGAVVKSAEMLQHFPAKACANVVDTTGAGDAFIGALAWSLVRQRPLSEAIPFAASVSALAIQKYGGQSAFPTLSDIEAHQVSANVT